MKDILVWPRDATIEKTLRHPVGRRFENGEAGTPWPNDQFTKRRVMEGSIVTVRPHTSPAVSYEPPPQIRAAGEMPRRPPRQKER